MKLTLASSNRKLYIVKDGDQFTVTLTMDDKAAWIELDRKQVKEIVEFLQEGLK